MTPRKPASEDDGASEADAPSPLSNQDAHRDRPASAPVIAGRLVLLAVAATALAGGILLTRARDRERESTQHSTFARYLCPMHPEVTSPVLADCPICGMALELAVPKAASSGDKGGGRIVDAERRVVTQTVRAPAWLTSEGRVTAVLHKDDLVGYAPGEAARFFPRKAPAAGRRVRLSPGSQPWDGSTVQVEFVVNDAAPIEPDTGWLQIEARPRELLVVPESAVLYTAGGAYVLAAPSGGRTFTQRRIEIGSILDSGHVADTAGGRFGAIVVLSGLQPGERVVAADTFFLDAERRLQAAQGRPAEVLE
jgi:hypothetical protein